MVWSPDFASKVLKLKKRSGSQRRAFFHAFLHRQSLED